MRILPSILAVAGLGGCTVADGDLSASAALVGLEVVATEDALTSRTTQVTGKLELGYTSEQRVRVQILDNGVVVYNASMDADKDLEHTIDATIDLLHEGANVLAVEATYNGETIGASLPLTVAAPLQALTLTPAATTVDQFSVGLSGSVTAGYLSDSPATLAVSVDGSPVVGETLDLSASTEAAISTVVPLQHAGANEVSATLSYRGAMFARSFSVTVEPPPPEVTFPTWTTDFTPGVELRADGEVEVVPASGWNTTAVRYSMDEGLTWLDAVDAGNDEWSISVLDPDINGDLITVAVDSANRGIVETTTWTDIIDVAPIFNCTDPGAMQPDNDMVQDFDDEVRTMLGYFGHPESGHSVSFVVTADADGDGNVETPGALLNYGRFGIDVSFHVSEYKCGGNCVQSYDLEVLVDGLRLCQDNNYGQIEEF